MKLLSNPYVFSIAAALAVFPLIALLITLPFTISNYRKYGGIAMLRTIIFYSFVLYMLCMFLLTALPLPSKEAVLKMDPISFNFLPFRNLIEGLGDFGMTSSISSWTDITIWSKYLRSSQFFQIIANIVMTIPLGIYLRYYFRCSLKKTILIGFLVSLFLEITQLTGLWFIYPRPYRCPDINDLMTNTLGTVIGFIITPIMTFFLPTRDEIDMISWRKGDKATIIRQIIAAILDWMIIGLACSIISTIKCSYISGKFVSDLGVEYYLPVALIYLIIIQRLAKGKTIGKSILNLKTISTKDKQTPSIINYLVRYILVYFLIPLGIMTIMFMVLITIILFISDNPASFRIIGLVGTSLAIMIIMTITFNIHKKYKLAPWDYYSRSKVIVSNRPDKPSLNH